MRRVLLVCHDTGYNVGWSFRHLLPDLGYETVCIDEKNYFRAQSWPERALRHVVGVPSRYRPFNQDIIGEAESFRPDLALFLKSPYAAPEMLARLRRLGTLLVNYSLDDWFSLNPKAISPMMRECIPLWDMMVTTKRPNVQELRAAGAQCAVLVRCGYDPQVHYPIFPTVEENREWQTDVLFVGTYEPDRAEQLQRLCERVSCRLRVYGNGWPSKRLKGRLRACVTGRPLAGREKLLAFACTKIALGFLRKANRDTYTDRSFEIPACNTFMLAERTLEHDLLYQEGTEIACFSDTQELIEKTAYYLQAQEREQIAAAGYRRVIAGQHTYRDRLLEILSHASSLWR